MQDVSCLICGAAERWPVLTLKPDVHRRLNPATSTERVRFVVCRGCGFIYQTPRFTLDELKPIYEEEYRKEAIKADGVPKEQYIEFTRNKSQREFVWIKKQLPSGDGSMNSTRRSRRVLEIGCATGQLLRCFKDEGWQAVGVEPTRSFAEYGTRTHGVPILPVLFEEADISQFTQAGVEPGFDLVILSQVLEHVQEPAAVLTRATSLLSPKGWLYVSIPYYDTYLPIRPARELFISTHLYAFSPVSLANLASHCGLAVTTQGTMSRYLCALLRSDSAIASRVVSENAATVRRRVWGLALRYFVLHDSRFLLAKWTKRRIRAFLGEENGERTIEMLRHLKHRLFRTEN